MSWADDLIRDHEQRAVEFFTRNLRINLLGPQFFLDRKKARHPRSAKKRRVVKKWRNALLKHYGEWF
jgi:hypothetical protein